VRENFIIFLFGKYITGNVIYSSFLGCTLLRDQSWHFGEICTNVMMIWIFGFASSKLRSSKLWYGIDFADY